jgi:hypothetical protein
MVLLSLVGVAHGMRLALPTGPVASVLPASGTALKAQAPEVVLRWWYVGEDAAPPQGVALFDGEGRPLGHAIQWSRDGDHAHALVRPLDPVPAGSSLTLHADGQPAGTWPIGPGQAEPPGQARFTALRLDHNVGCGWSRGVTAEVVSDGAVRTELEIQRLGEAPRRFVGALERTYVGESDRTHSRRTPPGEALRIRARGVGPDGRTGPWTPIHYSRIPRWPSFEGRQLVPTPAQIAAATPLPLPRWGVLGAAAGLLAGLGAWLLTALSWRDALRRSQANRWSRWSGRSR